MAVLHVKIATSKVEKIRCGHRKYPVYSPNGRSLEIPRGRGVLKAKLLEEKCEAKLDFPGRGG